jgi:hypothetical protein
MRRFARPRSCSLSRRLLRLCVCIAAAPLQFGPRRYVFLARVLRLCMCCVARRSYGSTCTPPDGAADYERAAAQQKGAALCTRPLVCRADSSATAARASSVSPPCDTVRTTSDRPRHNPLCDTFTTACRQSAMIAGSAVRSTDTARSAVKVRRCSSGSRNQLSAIK